MNAQDARRHFQTFFGMAAVVILTLTLAGCLGRYSSSGLVSWDISPDGSKLAYRHCGYADKKCSVDIFDFDSNSVTRLANATPHYWGSPRFSSDGKTLGLNISEEDTDTSHIALMNIDGGNYRIVTEADKIRGGPSFAPDDSMLVYMCAGHYSEKYFTPAKGNVRRLREREICALNLSTNQEYQLTDLDAYAYGRPTFLPDGEHVVYEFEDGYRDESSGEFIVIDETRVTNIHTLKTEVVFEGEEHSKTLSSRSRNRVVFSQVTNKMDAGDPNLHYLDGVRVYGYNYDIFVWDGDDSVLSSPGNVRRLTKGKSYLSGLALSADGSTIAYAFDPSRKGKNMKFYRMNIDSGVTEPFEIPSSISQRIEVQYQP